MKNLGSRQLDKQELLGEEKVHYQEPDDNGDVAVAFPTNGSDNGNRMQPIEITLGWNDVNISTHERTEGGKCFGIFGKRERILSKDILRNVNGIVRPGELLAIMGASGAGKTTLLNFLTTRNLDYSKLDISGIVTANGVPIKAEKLTAMSAYVQQDDLFIGTLTVKEHLKFQALLRMEKHFSYKQRMDRVDEVILELGLGKCASTVVGVPGRLKGISGGEKKRLAFACEVLTDPPLMFCDEPTSGLDSFMAQNVVGVLKAMAEKGKTVISTIHQPSSEVYAMFDRILLMAEGRVAYLGDVDGAFEFFKERGHQVPQNYNPADFYVHILAIQPGNEVESRTRAMEICDAYDNSDEAKNMREITKIGAADPDHARTTTEFVDQIKSVGMYRANWWSQFAAVYSRSLSSVLREPLIIKVRLFQTLVIALLLGLIYLQQNMDQAGIQNINGALFLCLTNMTFQNAFAVINVFTGELPIFLREHFNGMYRVDVYFLSKTFAELPLFIAYPAVFVVVIYWMIGLNHEWDRFLMCLLIIVLVANCSCSFGYLISSVSSSATMALSLAPPIIVPFMLFGGFFLNNNSVPIYFVWLKYLSWFYYGNEALSVNQWHGVQNITCSNDTTSCLQTGDMVLDTLNFDSNNLWRNVGFLALLILMFRIVAFFALLLRTMGKR